MTKQAVADVQLALLDALDAFCREKGIRYYLWAGTLLGAVRHQGFIPWDDDIDLAMTRDQYDRFCREFPDSVQAAPFELHTLDRDPTWRRPFAKIADPRTLVLAESPLTMPIGVSIDVFPLDAWPDGPLANRAHGVTMRTLHTLLRLWASRPMPGRSPAKRMFLSVVLPIVRLVSPRVPLHVIDRVANRSGTRFMGVTVMKYVERVVVEAYGEPVSVEFEGRVLPGPADADQVLANLYGDYMKLPPESDRKGHARSSVTWVRA